MALAHITYGGSGDSSRGRAFDIDLGTVNRFYQYAIGEESHKDHTGIEALVHPGHLSRLFGPVPDSSMGRLRIEIPHVLFNRENFRVQLKSYRDQKRSGPAISDVVVTPRTFSRLPHTVSAMSTSVALNTALEAGAAGRAQMMSTVPYPYRPEMQPVSETMFIQGLLGMLPKMLPGVGNLLGGLFGGGGKKSTGTGGGGPLDAVLKMFASNPEIQKVLGDLVGNLLKGAATGKSLSQSRHAVAFGHPGSYSEAMIAPAVMAILSQVLTPETVQAIVKSVPEVLAATGKAVAEIGNVANKQVQQHLDQLLKVHNTEDATLERMLGPMSLANMVPTKHDLRYRRVRSVKLHFGDVVPLTVGGKKKISYSADRDLRFPVNIEAPRPLGDAVLEVALTRAITNEELYRRKVKVADLRSGPIAKVPRIPREVVDKLTVGENHFVRVTVTWRSKKGELVGTSRIQGMTPSASTVFADIERVDEPIVLADATRFREYWHRIWHGRLTDERRRLSLEVKYVYGWAPQGSENARSETLVKLDEPEHRKVEGMIKGGLLVSPFVLNDLLPRLFERAPLEPDELEAIRSGDFADRFNGSARTKVTIKGRPGASAAIWVMPEVALHRVKLRRASQIDDNGHITAFEDVETVFPLPVAAHVIGTRSQS